MSTFKVPGDNKQIVQSNNGDYAGNVWSTFNIDLDSNPGVIKTSKRLTRVLGPDDIGSQVVQALQIHDGFYYLATNSDVYRCSVNSDPTDNSNWSDVSTFGADDLGFESDLTSFNGLLLVSLGTDIASWDGSTKDADWWTNVASGTALTADVPHIMEVVQSQKETLYVTNGESVHYYEKDGTEQIVELDSFQKAGTLAPGLSGSMWVGSYTEVGNNAYVYEIRTNEVVDSTPVYNQAYAIDGRAALSVFMYKNTPFVITERGYIQVFNGAGFETIAQFPWANGSSVMQGARPGLVQDSPTSKAIHPKGARVRGDKCFIYVDASDEYGDNTLLSNRGASGVWVLDLKTFSLTHRYGLTQASTDFGVQKVNRSGPLLITNTPQTRIMVGGDIDNDGVWMESDDTPQGYFVTVRHEANSIADKFEKFVIKTDTLATSDSITVKYKDVSKPNLPLNINNITWKDNTRFTTTNALTGVSVGDEVEIVAGHYAGSIATITKIEGGTTKTVTVDTTFGTLNETSDVRIDAWKIIKVLDATNTEKFVIGGSELSPSRQYKVILKGDITVREVISKSNSGEEL